MLYDYTIILGHFLSLIGGTYWIKKGHLLSETFEVNPNYNWCLQFWYYMFGDGQEALTVHMRYLFNYFI